jgi:hypothetical protein
MAVNAMDKKTIKYLDSLLSGCLAAILALSFLMFTFVFIINWEDWFFGTRLAGPLAGVYLFAKAAMAFALIFLLVQYPRYRIAGTVAAVAYFGFLFLDSSVTIRQNTAGQQPFSALFAVFLAIPILLLILTLVTGKPGTGRDADQRDTGEKCVAIPQDKGKRLTIHPLLLLLGGMVLLMIGYIIVIPLGIHMIITHTPFLHQMALPPARDSLVTRVSPKGTLGWQVMIKGYNLGNAEVVSVPDGGYIIFGPYWISGEKGLVNRAVNINRDGTMVWDWHRISEYGPQGEIPDTIQLIIPENGEFLLILDNGRTVRLDSQGNTLSEGITTDEERTYEAGILFPVHADVSPLPAPSASVRIRSENGQSTFFTIEDTVSHKELQNVDVVNPTSDGGYLVSASVKP